MPTELAQTACSRCRDQKLRCSREQPKCERCLRLNATCVFPEPPDRKKLASLRATNRKRKAEDAATGPDAASSATSTGPVLSQSPSSEPGSAFQYPLPTLTRRGTPVSATTNEDIEIPEAVQRALQAIYFTCVFNSTLLFHREEFVKSHANGDIPRHTRLAMYAMASNFAIPGSVSFNNHSSVFQHAGDLRSQSRYWATLAGREVLQEVDMPTLNSVRTCQILALYWFSQGETQRNTMFSGIAYRAARVLRLDAEGSEHSWNHLIGGEVSTTPWLHNETVRRCMWATWLTGTINSDHYVVGTSADPRILAMPLPMSEAAYNGKIEQPLLRLSDNMQHGRIREDASVTAAYARLILIWAKIRDYIETGRESHQQRELTNLFTLDAELACWTRTLHPSLVYSRSNLHEQLAVMRQPCFAHLHTLYHQCRLVLHASLVPQFSGIAPQEATPSEAVHMSAQVALKSAQAVSDLAVDLIELDWDPAQLAPFIGYSMYTAATIHLPFVASHDQRLREKARRHLTASLKMLKLLKPFWMNLEKLWARIHLLYEVQTNKIRAAAYGDNSSSTDGEGIGEHICRVASTKRDPGRLAEPLADSVLDYGLRRLQQNIDIDEQSPSAQELEMVIRPERQTQSQATPIASPATSQVTQNVDPALQQVPTSGNVQDNNMASEPSTYQQLGVGPGLQNIYGSLMGAMPANSMPETGGSMQDWWQWDFADVPAIMPWQDVFDTTNVM